MTDRRTTIALALLAAAGFFVATLLLSARSDDDAEDLGSLVVRAGGDDVEATLVATKPCERTSETSDCVTLELPQVREPGSGGEPTDGLPVGPGTEMIIDAGGPARAVTAYVGRYLRTVDEPLAGGNGVSARFERIEADPVESTPRRWSLVVPSLPPGANIVVVRVDHASSVVHPLTTAAGDPGEGRLRVAYYEAPIRPAEGP